MLSRSVSLNECSSLDIDNSLFSRSADAMLLIENNMFIACNDATLALFQLTDKKALYNSHPSRLSPEFQPCGAKSKIKAEQMMALASKNGSHRFEWQHKNSKGTNFPVEVLLTRLNDSGRQLIHAVIRDLSCHQIQAKKLQISKLFYNNVTNAIMVTNADLTIVDINPAFTAVTGYSREETIGQKAGFMKSGKHNQAFYSDMWQQLKQAGHWEGVVYDRHKKGHVFPKHLRIDTVCHHQDKIENYIGVFSNATQKSAYEKKLKKLAYYDQLTKLPNRRLLLDKLKQKIIDHELSLENFSVFLIGLDNFKLVNDTEGHLLGDQVLKLASQRIKAQLNKQDFLARISGDEFAILVNGTNEQSNIKTCQSVINAFKHPMLINEINVDVAISIGVSCFPFHGKTSSDLLGQADIAMNQVKMVKGSAYALYDNALGKQVKFSKAMYLDIKQALNLQQFQAFVQPKLCLKTQTVCGAEALARWIKPDGRCVPTHDFITVAENTGLIDSLSMQIFAKSCDMIAKQALQDSFRLSINISGEQLSNSNLYEEICQLIKKQGVNFHHIELEVTESQLIDSFDVAKTSLAKLRELGITVALDDFGTGYSSFSYLKQFPVDVIKLDRSFVKDLGTENNAENEVIVAGIIKLAHALGAKVVGEGVETLQQLTILTKLQCDVIQGYYFQKPMDSQSFIQFYQQHFN